MTPEQPDNPIPPDHPVFAPPSRDPQYGRRYARWAIWGCGGLVLALLLLFLGFMLVLLKGPNGKALITETENVAICREHMVEVSGALDRYHKDKGKAPVRLEDLYPTYLADKANLHCPSDPKDEEVSYIYRPKLPWGKGEKIVAFCPYHRLPVPLSGMPESDQPYIVLYIRQDGRVDRMSATKSQIDVLRAQASGS